MSRMFICFDCGAAFDSLADFNAHPHSTPAPTSEPVAWAVFDNSGLFSVPIVRREAEADAERLNAGDGSPALMPFTVRPLYAFPVPAPASAGLSAECWAWLRHLASDDLDDFDKGFEYGAADLYAAEVISALSPAKPAEGR